MSTGKISTRQNSPDMLRLLKAMRQAYANAKKISRYQLTLSVTAGLGAVVVHFLPDAKAWVGLYGVVATVVDAMLEPWGTRSHETGAQVQEMFDTFVFDLPSNGAARPDPEVRDELADEFEKTSSMGAADGLKDWYPVAVDTLPIEQARLVCQRSNMQWDAKLRERVWIIYLFGILGVVVGAMVWSLANKLTFEDFVISCMVPLLPAALQFWRKLNTHRAAAKESERGKERINRLWARVTKGELTSAELASEARQLEDGLYERRRRSPQVPDLVYKWNRTAYEKQMKTAAAEMVAEASKAGVLS